MKQSRITCFLGFRSSFALAAFRHLLCLLKTFLYRPLATQHWHFYHLQIREVKLLKIASNLQGSLVWCGVKHADVWNHHICVGIMLGCNSYKLLRAADVVQLVKYLLAPAFKQTCPSGIGYPKIDGQNPRMNDDMVGNNGSALKCVLRYLVLRVWSSDIFTSAIISPYVGELIRACPNKNL